MSTAARAHDGTNRWGVSELVDLEAQLFADREQPESELLARDERIVLAADDLSRPSVLAAWVHAIRRRSKAKLPGRALERAYRQATGILVLISFLLGWGSVSAVLQFTGAQPVNVLVVLGVFVVGQLLAVMVTIVAFAFASSAPALFESRPVVVLIRAGVAWLWHRGRRRIPDGDAADVLNWMRRRRPLYTRVERHLVFGSLQRAAVSFNLGVLTAFLIAVTFTDLAFGWSTTLRIGSHELYRACSLLAAPWASWWEEAAVSMELVRATQYSRLEGAYLNQSLASQPADPFIYGQWWRFLVMSIFTYGLLPRVILLVGDAWSSRRAFRALPPSTPEVERLLIRLTGQSVKRRHRDDPADMSRLGEGYAPVRQAPQRFDQPNALCTRWRDADFAASVLDRFLLERYGLHIEGELGNAGGHNYQDDESFLSRVATSESPVFVVAEPWATPDRAFRRFVAQLRAAAGDERAVIVVLTESEGTDGRAIWSGYLSEMADPHLALDRTAMSNAEGPS